MIKRIFGIFFGLGIGLLVGAFVVRKMEEATRAVAPSNLAHQAGRSAGALRERLRLAFAEAREAATAREAELRAEYAVPTAAELLRRR